MVGMTSFEAYIPAYRLSRDEISRGWGSRSIGGERAVAKSLAVSVGPSREPINQGFDYAHIEENVRASEMAYAEAGIKDPREELTVAEVHDCFTIHEMLVYEDLGRSKKGGAAEDMEVGTFTLKGELPVSTDGGLKCFGHPLGASGLRMQYEVFKPLQEKAGPRQVKNPRLGLTHNLGGCVGRDFPHIHYR